MNKCLNVYMLCEPKFLLPLDFDSSLKHLCARNSLNYGTCRNALSRCTQDKPFAVLKNGNIIERVTLPIDM